MPTFSIRTALSLALVLGTSQAQAQTGATAAYAHFEARQTHPIGLTPDGTRLLALNSPEGRLSVFDVSNPANPTPVLLAEIPVGLEPVSLQARTNDEVWVVNEVSDSLSIVSLSLGATVATLSVPDEPADIVFAQNKAFVSCGRNNVVRVFDALTRQEITSISLEGLNPRALATSADGTTILAAFQLSGNSTTTLPPAVAPDPPAPTTPALPAAPKTGLIVEASDPRVPYTVLDRDVVEIDATTHRIKRYHAGTGTNLFDLAVQPGTSDIWVANTDARNLVRFEPQLRGQFVFNRVTRVASATGNISLHDLNPGIDYGQLPNPSALAASLAQPTSIVFSQDGARLWVAAFGSDRVAELSGADGSIVRRIDVRPSMADSRQMRGPRGLVLHPTRDRLYVMNKLSDTISVIDTAATATAPLLAETAVASHDPMPPLVRQGRGYLFDARLSGNGTASCASCHLDTDRDGLAWDLGDPSGAMVTVNGKNNSIHDSTPRPRVMHPMKGPMTTQTLRGMQPHRIFHWRGDRPDIQSFNPTFRDLLGGSLISDDDMDALAAYLLSVRHHANPNRQLDRSLPPMLDQGNPTRGRDLFNNHVKSHCVTCHTLPTGSDENIDLRTEVGANQPIKTVALRTVYQRAQFNGTPGAVNVTGYGLLHDGTGFQLPRGHFYVLDTLETLQELDDVTAFLMCFDTGTAPTVGFSRTLTHETASDAEAVKLISTLERQAAIAACDAVVRGRLAGQWRQFSYEPATQTYRLDTATTQGLPRSQLLALLEPGDALTFLGVPPGQGPRMGADRDGDGLANADETVPSLAISLSDINPQLTWPDSFPDWTPENKSALPTAWQPLTAPRTQLQNHWQLNVPNPSSLEFFRLRRTW